jgi:hypothetical protein
MTPFFQAGATGQMILDRKCGGFPALLDAEPSDVVRARRGASLAKLHHALAQLDRQRTRWPAAPGPTLPIDRRETRTAGIGPNQHRDPGFTRSGTKQNHSTVRTSNLK